MCQHWFTQTLFCVFLSNSYGHFVRITTYICSIIYSITFFIVKSITVQEVFIISPCSTHAPYTAHTHTALLMVDATCF